MNKNIQLLLFFSFLLCIYLSYNNKEGFVVIDKTGFDARCNVGHDCVVTQSGASGFICDDNPDAINYQFQSRTDGDDEAPVFSDPFPLSLDEQQPWNLNDADPEPNAIASISSCTTSNSPYELSGCIPK